MLDVYRPEEGTRMEEMHGKKKQLNIPVDPTTVGDTQNQLIDESGDKKISKKNKEEMLTIPNLSIAEMQKLIDTGKKELGGFAQINPDWLPAKGSPEAESKLAGDMEKSINMVA